MQEIAKNIDINEILKVFGVTKGLFVIFFLLMHLWIFLLYKGRLNDRQKEIDRIAEENKVFRNFFMDKLKEKM